MDLGLDGRVALVCGSTRGLGRAVARALALEGARVAVNGRHAVSAQRAATELSRETDSSVASFVADVSVPEQAEAMVHAAAKALG
ncbi:MAG: SDR family NAD(P)-dependent oxidoreductase, partial [Gemmatimonadales bacterium]